MRIALVISQLSAGGAERVMAQLANHWAGAGHSVTLITLGASASEDYYPLSASVVRVSLGVAAVSETAAQAVRYNLRRIRELRKALRASRFDAVVSFMVDTNLLALLASVGLGLRLAVCERVDPRRHAIAHSRVAVRRLMYPRASAVVVQTEALRAWASSFEVPVYVLQNSIEGPLDARSTRSASHGAGRRLLAMGRLEPQKGFDLLITAFAVLAPRHPSWSLEILGEGSERTRLQAQIAAAGLDARVRLLGKMVPPWAKLNEADLFVLPSRYEGFPNALLEAMASGLAVVATDCPTGPADIVRDGVDGLLVPVGLVPALVEGLDRLMTDDGERARCATRARDVIHRFSPDRILAGWDDMLFHLADRKQPRFPEE